MDIVRYTTICRPCSERRCCRLCPPSDINSMSRLRCSLVFSITKRPLRCPQLHLVYARTYAASNESASNILERQIERGMGKDTSGTPSSVGPFPLGVQPLNLRSSRETPVKPWNQLTTGGKGVALHFRAWRHGLKL